MPAAAHDLTRLDANTFEHLVNMLALRVLGLGHTGFSPGPDGGRDGLFEGTAPYPSDKRPWSGRWYIQSKFLLPGVAKDQHKWLLQQVRAEVAEFTKSDSRRDWPDNWILVTNVDPSGVPDTGSFDRARAAVKAANPRLAPRFHIWGGRKILDLLALHPEVARYYTEFLTPGQVLATLQRRLSQDRADDDAIIRYLTVTQFKDQQYTKLEQAGSTSDNRPGLHRLFTDVPYRSAAGDSSGMAGLTLALALAEHHRVARTTPDDNRWREWALDPRRARVWFVKGGPGQGKSTLTQYICQVQRAALILQPNGPTVRPQERLLAREIRSAATANGLWPLVPRMPLGLELKEFAQWFGRQPEGGTRRVLAFLAEQLGRAVGEQVSAGSLKSLFGSAKWLFVFDGLDEVPGDVKGDVAAEVSHFINDVLVGCGADAAVICTSRPQGYAGQFSSLDAATVELCSLSKEQALACARPLLELGRSAQESKAHVDILREALQSPAVAEIMTSPLQSHIMAVIVRDGGRPPDRKWQLFDTFYRVIKSREANKNFVDKRLATLLRQGDKLLKALHNRLGFELHARAETSEGAVTSLARSELQVIVEDVVSQLQDTDVPETVKTLMDATTNRLVLVNTPENTDTVRFDIRPLQEFFAAEYIYQGGERQQFHQRLQTIAGDSHWREVIHFLLSALIENNRDAEFAAAVSILSELDDGGEGGERTLNRRLARGALVIARLLQEGVLEQDKRIRGQVRRSLLPLMGCFEAPAELVRRELPIHSSGSLEFLRTRCVNRRKQSA